jgi:hypothetical protein
MVALLEIRLFMAAGELQVPRPASYPMKRQFPREDRTRFSGHLRHYHRSGGPVRPSWEEWVDGEGVRPGRGLRVLKAVGIVLALLALAGIIVGLFIELR